MQKSNSKCDLCGLKLTHFAYLQNTYCLCYGCSHCWHCNEPLEYGKCVNSYCNFYTEPARFPSKSVSYEATESLLKHPRWEGHMLYIVDVATLKSESESEPE